MHAKFAILLVETIDEKLFKQDPFIDPRASSLPTLS
jgi:hypothetical protein